MMTSGRRWVSLLKAYRNVTLVSRSFSANVIEANILPAISNQPKALNVKQASALVESSDEIVLQVVTNIKKNTLIMIFHRVG